MDDVAFIVFFYVMILSSLLHYLKFADKPDMNKQPDKNSKFIIPDIHPNIVRI